MKRLGRLLHELERRYNPNWPSQRRVPGGNADGEQWTDGGADSGEAQQATEFEGPAVSDDKVPWSALPDEARPHVAVFRLTPDLEAECEEQYERDTFLCTMIGSAACHAQAAQRYAACRTGRFIPPLDF